MGQEDTFPVFVPALTIESSCSTVVFVIDIPGVEA